MIDNSNKPSSGFPIFDHFLVLLLTITSEEYWDLVCPANFLLLSVAPSSFHRPRENRNRRRRPLDVSESHSTALVSRDIIYYGPSLPEGVWIQERPSRLSVGHASYYIIRQGFFPAPKRHGEGRRCISQTKRKGSFLLSWRDIQYDKFPGEVGGFSFYHTRGSDLMSLVLDIFVLKSQWRTGW